MQLIQTLDNKLEMETSVDGPAQMPGYPVLFDVKTWPLLMLDSHTVRLWVELDEDLSIEVLSDLSHLAPYMHEVWLFAQDCGIGDLIEPSTHASVKAAGRSFGYGEAQWAMEEGLIPRQPFQVELYARHYMSESLEGAEADCETRCDILQKQGSDAEQAAKFWEEWFRDFRNLLEIAEREVKASQQAMLQHPELLFVNEDHFWTHYSEDSPPNAVRFSLRSRLKPVRADGSPAYSASSNLAVGESEDTMEAWANLSRSVLARYPQFAHINLQELPSRSHNLQDVPVQI